jgi:LPXTG-motif cell wall-anchored protein
VGIPAAGCANGTPDTISGIPAVLPIVCNADDIAGAAAVREALDVYVLQVGGTSLAKETTASSEAFSVAPPETAGTPQCSDGVDNDGDGVADAQDPGCHTDNNAGNPDSYRASDDDETDRAARGDTGGSGTPECSDDRDNDGDGKTDADDPGCHVNNDINQPYNPDDDSEGSDGGDGGGNGGGGDGGATDASNLPFTGTDVVGLTLAGLLMLAGGMLLRRREGSAAL